MSAPEIVLVDDGTMDTVLRCTECGEEMRYNFDGEYGEGEQAYDAFVEWALKDARDSHECAINAPETEDEWAESELDTLSDGTAPRPSFPVVDLSALPAPAAAAESARVLDLPAGPLAVRNERPIYRPKRPERWTLPPCYAGAEWPDYFVFLGRTRNSRCLEESNFWSGLEQIGGETDTVIVIRENHWACGWVEWIAIHESDSVALQTADAIMARLENYPVVDREDDAANETWRLCYSPKERAAYIREHRSQFDFSSLADMIACVRGEFFNGYASELIDR